MIKLTLFFSFQIKKRGKTQAVHKLQKLKLKYQSNYHIATCKKNSNRSLTGLSTLKINNQLNSLSQLSKSRKSSSSLCKNKGLPISSIGINSSTEPSLSPFSSKELGFSIENDYHTYP